MEEIEGLEVLKGEDRLKEEGREEEMVDVEGSRGAATAEPAKPRLMTAAYLAEGTILQRLKEFQEGRWSREKKSTHRLHHLL